MKVCIFFDGQNFYRSLLRYDETLRVDYDRLAVWITQKIGGEAAVFGGAYYYVGVSSGATYARLALDEVTRAELESLQECLDLLRRAWRHADVVVRAAEHGRVAADPLRDPHGETIVVDAESFVVPQE